MKKKSWGKLLKINIYLYPVPCLIFFFFLFSFFSSYFSMLYVYFPFSTTKKKYSINLSSSHFFLLNVIFFRFSSTLCFFSFFSFLFFAQQHTSNCHFSPFIRVYIYTQCRKPWAAFFITHKNFFLREEKFFFKLDFFFLLVLPNLIPLTSCTYEKFFYYNYRTYRKGEEKEEKKFHLSIFFFFLLLFHS